MKTDDSDMFRALVIDLTLQQMSDLAELDEDLGATVEERRRNALQVYTPILVQLLPAAMDRLFDQIDAVGPLILETGLAITFEEGLTPERLRAAGLDANRDGTWVAAAVSAMADSVMTVTRKRGTLTLLHDGTPYVLEDDLVLVAQRAPVAQP